LGGGKVASCSCLIFKPWKLQCKFSTSCRVFLYAFWWHSNPFFVVNKIQNTVKSHESRRISFEVLFRKKCKGCIKLFDDFSSF
jgi:hypothetical protein